MILVTLGTNEQPFDRLVAAAAGLEVDEDLIVQHGASRVAPGRGRWVDFLDFDELSELVREARVVVSHAGVGSIMLARRHDKRPIVVPRRLHLGEAVDDHQLPFAQRLHDRGFVRLLEDERALTAIVTSAQTREAVAAFDMSGAADLCETLRQELLALRSDVVVGSAGQRAAASR